MKKSFIFIFILSVVFLQACKKNNDPSPNITVQDFTASIDENPSNGDVIGTVSASASDNSTLTFSLTSQSVAGALAIDANTGEISVANSTAFDFEVNTTITATYTADNGTDQATASINISINDKAEDFRTTWTTTSDNQSISIPAIPALYTYNYTVDWGDGTLPTTETGKATHTYAKAGTYQVSITGELPAIQFSSDSPSNRFLIKSIDQWGSIKWKSMEGAFLGCNIEIKATDKPNLSDVTDMSNMFALGSAVFVAGVSISDWDVSNVTNMSAMFRQLGDFNQDISKWDVSNVTNMTFMFEACTNFNQDISKWNVSKVTRMSYMFAFTSSFNQDISGWNVSNVIAMNDMFSHATSFNQNIGAWNVGKVINMGFMFSNADNFDQDLSNWTVSQVTSCSNFGFGIPSNKRPNFTNCSQ